MMGFGWKLRAAAFSLATTAAVALTAQGAGVLYMDPGWLHAYEGVGDYYHDPDGPNPNYTRASGPDDMNQPGGQGNEPALIDVGLACEPNCENIAVWQNNGSQWEGSAPGDPLGGPPGEPPVPPPAPGGAGAFVDPDSTTFLRIQDVGQPQNWGWADKGDQGFDTGPRQEGNNRRIEFKHQMSRDAGFSGDLAVLDSGVTISFRARIATRETAPLDDIYPEGGGTSPIPWPVEGAGYRIRNNARGMFFISQNGAAGPGRIAFSLLDSNAKTAENLTLTKTGLVMNAQASNGGPDTTSTEMAQNIVEIDNSTLTDWHEFWINIKALPSPVNNNTHEVTVYFDGSLTPEVFNVVLGNQNEAGTGSFMSMGLTSGSSFGAFDVDFYAYKEGVIAPQLAPMGLAGDYNSDGSVDSADYVVWRKSNGTQDGYNTWRTNFGRTAGGGAISNATVPEPATSILFVLGAAIRYRRTTATRFARSKTRLA
jgi:hypothetical protein